MKESQLSKRDRQRLDRAVQLARTSTSKARDGSSRHGALIIVGGRTIAVGVNKDRNDVLNVSDPRTQSAVHAEAAVLRSAGLTRVKGGTIYVARVGRSGEPAMSKPCDRCQVLLREAGIKKVVYTVDSTMDV